METETKEQEEVQVEQSSSLHQVTPLSKYLAMALFIILPFLGGYVGYVYSPEKVVEVEKVIIKTERMTKDSVDINLDEATKTIQNADSGWPSIALEYSNEDGSETAPWSTGNFSVPENLITDSSAAAKCGFVGEEWTIGEVYEGMEYIGFICSDEFNVNFYFTGEIELSGEVDVRFVYGAGGWLREDMSSANKLNAIGFSVDEVNIQSIDLVSITSLHTDDVYPERVDGNLVEVTTNVTVVADFLAYSMGLDCRSGDCFSKDGEPYVAKFLQFPVKSYKINSIEEVKI